MDYKTVDCMLSLLRYQICGDEELKIDLAWAEADGWKRLYALSKKQDIACLIGHALSNQSVLRLPSECLESFEKEQMVAIFRYENSRFALSEIERVFQENRIAFIPLKGAVIREYYPEPWMRTSCDIDILVHMSKLEAAVGCLREQLGYVEETRGPHDVSLQSPNGVHIELHYTLLEHFRAKDDAYRVLERVWELSSPDRPQSYHYVMADEMFYFYHVMHMAHHCIHGGCGVRPFIDLWILDHKLVGDSAARDQLLEEGKILQFANAARELCSVWFEGRDASDSIVRLQELLFLGGVYGTVENRVLVAQSGKKSRMRYFWSRVFVSYDALKYLYPVLQRHKWLFPLMQFRRWGRIVLKGRVKRSVRELQISSSISPKEAKETMKFLSEIGLSDRIG